MAADCAPFLRSISTPIILAFHLVLLILLHLLAQFLSPLLRRLVLRILFPFAGVLGILVSILANLFLVLVLSLGVQDLGAFVLERALELCLLGHVTKPHRHFRVFGGRVRRVLRKPRLCGRVSDDRLARYVLAFLGRSSLANFAGIVRRIVLVWFKETSAILGMSLAKADALSTLDGLCVFLGVPMEHGLRWIVQTWFLASCIVETLLPCRICVDPLLCRRVRSRGFRGSVHCTGSVVWYVGTHLDIVSTKN